MKKTSRKLLVPLIILALGIAIVSTVGAVDNHGYTSDYNANSHDSNQWNVGHDSNQWNKGPESNHWDKGQNFKSGYHGYWNYLYKYYWNFSPYYYRYSQWFYPPWYHYSYGHKKH